MNGVVRLRRRGLPRRAAEVEAALEIAPDEQLAASATEKLAALEAEETTFFMNAIAG